jgi:Peptidase M15
MAITMKQYWMGRDTQYASELDDTIRANAAETVRRANQFLETYHAATGSTAPDNVNSGWRPPSVNAATKNAAKNSPHLTGEAVDLSDDIEAIDRWITSDAGRQALVECDLYAEFAAATPRWAHLQTRKTASGNRIFKP